MKNRKKILLIDMANLGIRTGMSCYRDDPTDAKYDRWKEEILRKIVDIIQKTGASSVILCQEGKKNWRFEVYDKYKCHRKEEKAKSKMNFETYYPMFDDFCDKMSKYIPNVYQLKVDRAEGDDLVAVLTKHLTKKYDVVCFSSDRDFYQLLKYPGYSQYNPIKKGFVQIVNPERYLLEKIIVGDKGDGVPHVKNRVSKGTAPKILDEGLDEWLDKNNVRAEYERNKTLIDFDCIPVDVQDAILEGLKSMKYYPMSKRDFSEFIRSIECSRLFFDTEEFACTLSKMERIDAE